VRELVPQLWKEHPEIDVMIHIGMSGRDSFYALERRAHRDGYETTDVDGKKLPRGDAEEGGIWEGCPEELETGLDVDDVWRRWMTCIPVSCDLFTLFFLTNRVNDVIGCQPEAVGGCRSLSVRLHLLL
jgi:hypothetical protein